MYICCWSILLTSQEQQCTWEKTPQGLKILICNLLLVISYRGRGIFFPWRRKECIIDNPFLFCYLFHNSLVNGTTDSLSTLPS